MWLMGWKNLRTNLTVTNYFLFLFLGEVTVCSFDFKGLDPTPETQIVMGT